MNKKEKTTYSLIKYDKSLNHKSNVLKGTFVFKDKKNCNGFIETILINAIDWKWDIIESFSDGTNSVYSFNKFNSEMIETAKDTIDANKFREIKKLLK
jgi:hypothetical protein